MLKRWSLLGVILLVPLLVVSCGILKEDYDTAVADKEAEKEKIRGDN